MNGVITGVEGELRSNGISVESIDTGGETVELTYLTAFPGESVNHLEVGRALRTFVERVTADEWEPKRVEATVLRSDDDVQGTWHAEAEWFREYDQYELSDEDFSELVLGTLEGGE
ncbi:hypothetical protein [Halopelagius longus]|uniref:DUF8159 domain-containing protein n=1 Tax=Halopelagius longus TaxID=1236180 RepID=A0A1H0YEH2_9EURY|nr:hypothetical protein [Halopelagius longus]RDI72433.1 hypothetical protein DWB78_12305 [Halopelagius longus]SDQ13361.1 hypothetical protein SAMN05216278_0576 [Halopelagius longus]